MKVYIEGTKKGINEQIADKKDPVFTEYNMFNPNGYMTDHKFSELKDGTVVSFYLKVAYDGSPIAKSYGQVKGGKIK